MAKVKRMSKKVFYSLAAIAACVIISCSAVLGVVLWGGNPPTARAATLPFVDHFHNTSAWGTMPYSVGGVTAPAPTVDNTQNAPGSPGGALRFTHPAGWPPGYEPGKAWTDLPQAEELWTEYWFKYSDEFEFDMTGQKHLYWKLDNVEASDFYLAVRNTDRKLWLTTQPRPQPPGYSANYVSNLGYDPTIQPGVWYKVTTYIKLNTTTSPYNGICRVWLNDIPLMDHTNVNYRTSTYINSKMNFLELCPVWGGNGPKVAKTGYMWFDAVRLQSNPIIAPLDPPNIASHGFDNGQASPFVLSNGAEIISTDSAPGSAPNSVRFTHPAGWGDGYQPGRISYTLNPTLDEIWLQFSFKFSENFFFHPAANKLLYVKTPGNVANWVLNCDWGRPQIVWRNSHHGEGRLNNYITPYTVLPGFWYTIKMHAKMNTGNNANGIFEMWINGTKVMDYNNVTFFGGTSANMKMGILDFDPIFGGAGNYTKPSIDNLYMDDFKISTADFHNDNPQSPTAPSNIVV